jgi:23S rRNA (cytidine1920-2'-O)/16S rRNA (cytidine1409-2'-O)-methyltransferase
MHQTPRPGRNPRERLDEALVARGLAETRSQARALIMAGQVRIGGQRADKAGMPVPPGKPIEVVGGGRFVSRGGEKLQAALDRFAVVPAGLVCADLGASTGGFTDCLLQAGAAQVFAVDVGYGQLHWRLRGDARVVIIERQNARHLEGLPEPVALVVADLSFISLALILPVIKRILVPDGQAIALVKPQFEAGREAVGKGGVVRDPATHRAVLARFVADARATGFAVAGLMPSPLRGPAGNIEFLAYLRPGAADTGDTEAMIDAAMAEVQAREGERLTAEGAEGAEESG